MSFEIVCLNGAKRDRDSSLPVGEPATLPKGALRLFWWLTGIQFRSGTRQEFRLPQLFESLDDFRYKIGH